MSEKRINGLNIKPFKPLIKPLDCKVIENNTPYLIFKLKSLYNDRKK